MLHNLLEHCCQLYPYFSLSFFLWLSKCVCACLHTRECVCMRLCMLQCVHVCDAPCLCALCVCASSCPLSSLMLCFLSSSGVNTSSDSLPKSHTSHCSELRDTHTPLSVEQSPDSGIVSTPVSNMPSGTSLGLTLMYMFSCRSVSRCICFQILN